MNRKGFTLIELMIVIMLTAILTVITLSSYQRTRVSAELVTQTDNIINLFREQKKKSENSSNPTCFGIQIENGQITLIEAPYQNPVTKCNQNELKENSYSEKDVKVISLKRITSDREISSIQILFTPPQGDVFVPTFADNEDLNKDELELKIGIRDFSNDQIIILNRNVGSIKKIYRSEDQ